MRVNREEFEVIKRRCGVRTNTELAALIYAETGIAISENYFSKCFYQYEAIPLAYSAALRLVAKLIEAKQGRGHAATA